MVGCTENVREAYRFEYIFIFECSVTTPRK